MRALLFVVFSFGCTLFLTAQSTTLRVGAERMDLYLPKIAGKRVGLVLNHTATVDKSHLLDTLLALGVRVEKVFVPEHGLRGTADAGEKVTDGKDPRTGVSVVSLYGKKRKPSPEDLAGIDVLLFDIQDVGVRFYTYISTLHYVMEGCAEANFPLMVLDRPNPNGHFVDGPILDTAYRSFVGMHPIPVAHGMTIGEYAKMINGERWLKDGIQCALEVIPCAGYTHDTPYDLPLKPSPNLPNMRSIYLYPSICYFEGTQVSLGRGTDKQFQVLGTPGFPKGDYTF
ncbi:MAG: exo-beta-N-acetylmuramidase NamZ domain-containing protein, partial [Haliscomenobacter sp.]